MTQNQNTTIEKLTGEKEIVDINTAAEDLGISPRTLRIWLDKYDLPYLKVAHTVRINLPLLKRKLEERFTVGAR